MTTIVVDTLFPERADVRRVEDLARIGYIELICNGVSYRPVEITRINDRYRCRFEVRTEPDTTPALSVSVTDSVGVGDRMG